MEAVQVILWLIASQLILLKLRYVLVDLCGHVTDGQTQFLPSASCHSLVRCRARRIVNAIPLQPQWPPLGNMIVKQILCIEFA